MASPAAVAARRPGGRFFLLDVLKATGCLLIVLHHLAFYGPMSEQVALAWPAGMDWLARHGRLAVQVFLVCSGFLAAQSLAGMAMGSWRTVVQATSKRYLRLATPLLAALALTVLVSELIRPVFGHDSLSDTPDWSLALAHVFFMQHALDLQALSAGVWYVAVDLQLFILALMLQRLTQALSCRLPGSASQWQTALILLLVVFSLTLWTHDDALDDTALFFWGAYGMGWLGWHARNETDPSRRWGLLLGLGVLCLVFDARSRALTAWCAMVLLLLAPSIRVDNSVASDTGQHHVLARAVSWLSRVSYAVFVVHFAVCLLVNFVVHQFWPASVAMNALGMGLAVILSLLAGHVLHRWTEQGAASWARWMGWTATFMASAGLAMWMAS